MSYILLCHAASCDFFNYRRTSLVSRLQESGTVPHSEHIQCEWLDGVGRSTATVQPYLNVPIGGEQPLNRPLGEQGKINSDRLFLSSLLMAVALCHVCGGWKLETVTKTHHINPSLSSAWFKKEVWSEMRWPIGVCLLLLFERLVTTAAFRPFGSVAHGQ